MIFDKLEKVLRAIEGPMQNHKQYKNRLRVHPQVGAKAWVRVQNVLCAKPEQPLESISAQRVEQVAMQLEALLVMTEGVSNQEMLTVELERGQLVHFVAYMRTLDASYRVAEKELFDIKERLHDDALKRQQQDAQNFAQRVSMAKAARQTIFDSRPSSYACTPFDQKHDYRRELAKLYEKNKP